MRKLPIGALRTGMKVARGVYGSSGYVLLQRGVVLTNRYIAQLKELGIPSLYVDDGILDDYYVDDVISEETRVNAVHHVRQLVSEAEQPSSKQSIIMRSRQMTQAVDNIVDELLSQPNLIVNLIDIRLEDDYLFAHCVNVCVLALITGVKKKLSRQRLVQLGLGAMLHDVGKTVIPKSILYKPGPLTNSEFEVVKTHTSRGSEILQDIPAAKDVAHEHHERYDGSGYPLRKKGFEIGPHSAITALCDVFDAVTADRVYRPAHSVHEAYELIAASGNRAFELGLVRDFLYNIAAYPTGTMVELSDGRTAVCMETPPGLSLFPRVRILFDEEKQPLKTPEEMDLSQVSLITVERVLAEREVLALRGGASVS
jgi:HD-GYP domain-containing protein (c-di-GMP phosphodiesterase class II)